jgi:hypothetical protein
VFDVPIDGWYAWLGVATTSGVLLATALSLPTAPPPDASAVANTVDRTAATKYGATAEHPLDATAVRITPNEIGLRNGAGTTHAAFGFEPVVPITEGTTLWRVLVGARQDSVATETLATAIERARDRPARWRRVDGPLLVRHLVSEEHDVTLVGA